MEHKGTASDSFGTSIKARPSLGALFSVKGEWTVTCRDKDGQIKWADKFENLVVDEGLDYLLDVGLADGTKIGTWYLGLTSSSPSVAAGDTLASKSWSEVEDYDEANRQTWVAGSVSGKSVSNTAAPAEFTIDDTVTVGGAFLASNNTKGGTTGTLYAAGAFTGGNRALVATDVLEVVATFTTAAA